MKKKALKDFGQKLTREQMIQKLMKKNLKGGATACPPPVEGWKIGKG